MNFLAAAADERVSGIQFSDDALSVTLRDGRVISVPLVWYPRLLDATRSQRENWKIAGGGYGIHWPDLDEDLSTEGLLRGAPAPKVQVPATDKEDIEQREDDGGYQMPRSGRAHGIEDTQAKAIERARQIDRHAAIKVERVPNSQARSRVKRPKQ
jgi:uncharacterized protein DUF2442